MRQRKIKKNFYLNYEEAKILKDKSNNKGISESELLRGFIKGYIPSGKPVKEIGELIYEIRKIGININQIAYVANKTCDIKYDYLISYLEKLDKLIFEIRNCICEVEKVNDL